MKADGKALITISGRMFGGGQQIAQDLLMQGRGLGVEIVGLRLGATDSELGWRDTLAVDYDGRYNALGTLVRTSWRVRRVIRRERPRVIHTHGWDADVIGYIARRGLNVRQLVHLHVMPAWLLSEKLRHIVRRSLTRRVFGSKATRIVAVSDAVRRHWTSSLGLHSQEIGVVHSGVDTAAYKPAPRGVGTRRVPVIGIATRLVKGKGLYDLVGALAILKQRGIAFSARIAGDGELLTRLKTECNKQGITGNVTFLRQVEDMPRFYHTLDVFALPSMTEGLPLTVLEAMASGVPVVCTKVGGIPEALRDGIDGFLVMPGSKEELVKKLCVLLQDSRLRTVMGKNARARAVEQFSLSRFANDIFAYYQ